MKKIKTVTILCFSWLILFTELSAAEKSVNIALIDLTCENTSLRDGHLFLIGSHVRENRMHGLTRRYRVTNFATLTLLYC